MSRMARFARQARAEVAEYTNIERPFSNFDFIEKCFFVNMYLESLRTLRRIMSQVRRHHGRTMVVEELDIDDADDLLEENEDLALCVPSFASSRAFRMSFFRSWQRLSRMTSEDFLGYLIVKFDEGLPAPHTGARVYESVLRPSSRENNFIRGMQPWECLVDGIPMRIDGYLYAQQNGLTNCCAHVALRTVAARYHPNGDMTYREMNDLTGASAGEIPGLQEDLPKVDHVNRRIGPGITGGLYPVEMVRILEAAGAHCSKVEYVEYDEPPPPPFEKYLYGSVESGYPAIVGFEAGEESQHAIPVFGHTFNEDTWVPSAKMSYFKVGPRTKYIPSDFWLSTFVGHDDNWGSNFCIPRYFLQTRPVCHTDRESPTLCKTESRYVSYVIGTFPKSIRIDATEAEVQGVEYLSFLLAQLPGENSPWTERLKHYAENSLLVFRPLLIDSKRYRRHLERISDWNHKRIASRQVELIGEALRGLGSKNLWMIELSLPELLSANRRKIAEVLIAAEDDINPDNRFDSFVLARFPGWFVLLHVDESGQPQSSFYPSGANGHVELYNCEEDAE